MEGIGLEDSEQRNAIIAATSRYVESQAVFKQVKACGRILAEKKDELLQLYTNIALLSLLYTLFLLSLSIDNYLLLESIYDLEGVSFANMFNQTSVVKPLLEDRDNKGRTALHRASESGNLL